MPPKKQLSRRQLNSPFANLIEAMVEAKSKEDEMTAFTPLWEVFVQPKGALAHKHCGSVHAADAEQALQAARDVYARREEVRSIWVVPSAQIIASEPEAAGMLFDPASDKIYRHPSFYDIPDDIENM